MRALLCCLMILSISAAEEFVSEADLSAATDFEVAQLQTQVQLAELTEVSGMVYSRQQQDIIWLINDSGNAAAVYAIDATGQLRAKITLQGIANRDWEAMASYTHQGEEYLIIADCGDNAGIYPLCALYIIKEPQLDEQASKPSIKQVSPERIVHYRYADGARDCEAVFVDEAERQIYFISKRDVPARVYCLGLHVAAEQLHTAQAVCHLEQFPQPQPADLIDDPRFGKNRSQITGASLSADNRQLYLSTYKHLYRYEKQAGGWHQSLGQKPQLLKRPFLRQGEALSIAKDGSLWFASEQIPWPLYKAVPKQP